VEPFVYIFSRSLFVILISLAVCARADPASELRIVTENFPPYNFPVDGEARGMSSEVVQAMLEYAGLKAEVEFFPWARAFRIAQTEPNTLIYSIARIPERELLFEWIGAIAPYRTSFYKLKSNTGLHIDSLDDARSHRIGVSQADVIKIYLENRGFEQLEVVSADHLAIRMLYLGRMELLAFDEAAMPLRVKKEGLDISLLERVFRIDELSKELYVAIHPDSDPSLIRKLRDSLSAIKQNGEYQAIKLRYFPEQL